MSIASPLVAELSGLTSLPTVLGMLFFLRQIGGAAGPIVSGLIFDITGAYRPASIILVADAAIGLLLASRLKRMKPGEREGAT